MPISGWIMFGWFWLVILTGVGLLYWGWRKGRLPEWEEPRYIVLEEREAQLARDAQAGGASGGHIGGERSRMPR